MTTPTGRLACVLTLLLASGCSDHGTSRTAELLNDRLRTELAPDINAGTASVQPLPDGAQVTLLGASRFANTVDTRTDKHREVRAGVVQGLLDPTLVRIAVADTSALPTELREARVRNVKDYFQENGLGYSLLPDSAPTALPAGSAASAQGLTITVKLDCPPYRQPNNWNYLPPVPSCH
jgi:hypothetical protein